MQIVTLVGCALMLAACGGGGGDEGAEQSKGDNNARGAPPTISGVPPTIATTGVEYSFTPAASDSDGDPLSFKAQNVPAWATLDAETGRLSGTPLSADTGRHAGIVLSVSDGANSAALPAFTISVIEAVQVNAPPELSGEPPTRIVVGQNYRFVPEASDPDGNALLFTVSNLPGWLRFDSATGALNGTPASADVGTFFNITINVSDGKLTDTIGPFDLTVALPGVPPELEITGTEPAGYLWNTLAVSQPVYLDRNYTFVTIPEAFVGLPYLITANNDKRQTADPFVRFTVNVPVTVYVAYDARSSDLPAWLDGWTATGETWRTTDTTFNVFARDFDAGLIGLGGNVDAESMYSVAVEVRSAGGLLAVDDSAETRQNTPVSVAVLANDAGLDNPPVSLAIATPATNGTATASPFGTVLYTPADGFVGTDSFAYTISDALGNTGGATVTVNVTQASQDAQPASFDDSYEVLEGTTLTMNVLDNDTGLFDAPLSVSVETPTSNGSLSVVAGNAIEYTSNSGFSGADAFTYRVTDADGDFDIGAVSISVLSLNAPPTIDGVPVTTVVAGTGYSFTPTAFDADGDTLSFSIFNRPAWAQFDAATGALTGTPQASDAGTTANIVIQVTDGEATASLAPFSITVAQSASGTATVSWDPPTQNVDGSPLNDLAGYRIYYGTTPGSYPNQVAVNNPGLSSFVVENLAPGTYYFVTTAFDAAGNESALSNVATKTLP
ncbi:MAG: Ig-like domain-containing protein [Pseudomonadota bacterium]